MSTSGSSENKTRPGPPTDRVRCWQEALHGDPAARKEVEVELYRWIRGALMKHRIARVSGGGPLEDGVSAQLETIFMAVLDLIKDERLNSERQLNAYLKWLIPKRMANVLRELKTPWYQRRAQAGPPEDLEAPKGAVDPIAQARDPAPSPDEVAEASERYARFRRTVRARLTEEEWQMWEAFHEKGLKPAEIAEEMGKTANLVRVRIHRMDNEKLKNLWDRLKQGESIDEE